MDVHAGRYEFTPSQNEVLQRAARWSRLLAWFLIFCSVLLALGGLFSGEAGAIGSLIAAAIYFVVALEFRGAAGSLAAVVETAGNDMDHLMAAVDRLAAAFKWMAITLLVGSILFVAAVVSIWVWMGSLEG